VTGATFAIPGGWTAVYPILSGGGGQAASSGYGEASVNFTGPFHGGARTGPLIGGKQYQPWAPTPFFSTSYVSLAFDENYAAALNALPGTDDVYLELFNSGLTTFFETGTGVSDVLRANQGRFFQNGQIAFDIGFVLPTGFDVSPPAIGINTTWGAAADEGGATGGGQFSGVLYLANGASITAVAQGSVYTPGAGATWGAGDVINMVYDAAAPSVSFYKNGVLQFTQSLTSSYDNGGFAPVVGVNYPQGAGATTIITLQTGDPQAPFLYDIGEVAWDLEATLDTGTVTLYFTNALTAGYPYMTDENTISFDSPPAFGNNFGIVGNVGRTYGQYYFEVTASAIGVTDAVTLAAGVTSQARLPYTLGVASGESVNQPGVGIAWGDYGLVNSEPATGTGILVTPYPAAISALGVSTVQGDVLGFAVDITNGVVYVFKNGTYTGASFAIPGGWTAVYPLITATTTTSLSTAEANFTGPFYGGSAPVVGDIAFEPWGGGGTFLTDPALTSTAVLEATFEYYPQIGGYLTSPAVLSAAVTAAYTIGGGITPTAALAASVASGYGFPNPALTSTAYLSEIFAESYSIGGGITPTASLSAAVSVAIQIDGPLDTTAVLEASFAGSGVVTGPITSVAQLGADFVINRNLLATREAAYNMTGVRPPFGVLIYAINCIQEQDLAAVPNGGSFLVSPVFLAGVGNPFFDAGAGANYIGTKVLGPDNLSYLTFRPPTANEVVWFVPGLEVN
jgi:hypothetical protein